MARLTPIQCPSSRPQGRPRSKQPHETPGPFAAQSAPPLKGILVVGYRVVADMFRRTYSERGPSSQVRRSMHRSCRCSSFTRLTLRNNQEERVAAADVYPARFVSRQHPRIVERVRLLELQELLGEAVRGIDVRKGRSLREVATERLRG